MHKEDSNKTRRRQTPAGGDDDNDDDEKQKRKRLETKYINSDKPWNLATNLATLKRSRQSESV